MAQWAPPSPSGRRPSSWPLLDRDGELAELGRRLADARGGSGGMVAVEGPPGIGKSALLAALSRQAGEAGTVVLAAHASEFEQAYPWGVVRTLFASAVALPEAEREKAFAGAARLADVAVGLRRPEPRGEAGADVEALGAACHGLYWLTANLAARDPLLVVVDDVQWADVPSLRWLGYLAARVSDLPVLLAVGLNPAERADQPLLLALAARAAATLRPAPLTEPATARLVRDALGDGAPPELGSACHAATGGNPFLVQALLDELRRQGPPAGAAAEHVEEIESTVISRALLMRLARLPPEARELAAAVAVWGRKPTLGQAADLAGMDRKLAVRAADSLAAAAVIGPGEPLGFVHPIVHTAVYNSIPSHERSVQHARAAELLEQSGAPPDSIAAQLLAVDPSGDTLLVDVLRDAAEAALAGGALDVAVTYLQRALAEPPAREQRSDVLRRLGGAELSLQRPEAMEHLQTALEEAGDPRQRAEIARELAVPLVHSGHVGEAVSVLERALAELAGADRELSLRLEADFINAGRLRPDLRARALTRAKRLRDAGLRGRTLGERVALAAIAGEGDAVAATAGEAVACAERALGGGRLLSEAGAESLSYWYAVSGLVLADCDDEAESAVALALEDAGVKGSLLGSALSHCFRSLLEYRTGRLADAEADARQAIEIAPRGRWAAKVYSLAFLIEVLLDRGRPEEAESAVAANGIPETAAPLLPFLVFRQNRGRLRIKLGQVEAGLADIQAAAKGFAAGRFGPCLWPWRSHQALALAGAGHVAQARELAREEEAMTRAFGAPRARGVALRALGVVESGDAGISSLREAVSVLDGSPATLEHARALIDLGALLRRGGHRADALEQLRAGLDRAHACGAGALAEAARSEMTLAGARPRRNAVHGRDALTAGELRVARMAAGGMTNRGIAQALFVSLRTVETHLTHIYRKLSIDSRDALAGSLEPERQSGR